MVSLVYLFFAIKTSSPGVNLSYYCLYLPELIRKLTTLFLLFLSLVYIGFKDPSIVAIIALTVYLSFACLSFWKTQLLPIDFLTAS